jgi:serine/threonine protein phosphatase PrpC
MAYRHYVWAATDVGRTRPQNEDRFLVGSHQGEGMTADWHGVLSAAQAWVLVADGMGGHDAGEVASGVALSAIEAGLPDVRSPQDVAALLDAANLRVFEAMYGERGRPGMGTTIVGALLFDDRALIFNVGDSRAYRLFAGRMIQLSDDHSLGATASGRRSPLLTQSLGGTMSRRALSPRTVLVDLSDASEFLLCSDGLTDLIPDDEIAAIITRNREDPARALVNAANDAGGSDNITAVIVSARKS